MKKNTIALICLFLLLIALSIILWFSKDQNYIPYIAVGASIVALYFSLVKYWMDSDAFFKSLFESLNKRFDELNEDLNLVAKGNPPITKSKLEEVIQDYLNLCAEEYFWYKKDRIHENVWNSWVEGISYYLENADIKNYFQKESSYSKSYYGFLDFLKRNNKL